jgi:histone H3/H4
VERLLNHSGIKAFLRKQNVRMGRHMLSSLEERVKELLFRAITRAKQNKRKTLFGGDL